MKLAEFKINFSFENGSIFELHIDENIFFIKRIYCGEVMGMYSIKEIMKFPRIPRRDRAFNIEILYKKAFQEFEPLIKKYSFIL